jgi:hypothetical protein
MATPSPSAPWQWHPHLALLGRLRAALLLLAGMPAAIGLAIALVVPLACGGDAGFQRAVAWFELVLRAEVRQSGIASPAWPASWCGGAEDGAGGPARWAESAVAHLEPPAPPIGASSAGGAPRTAPLARLLSGAEAWTVARAWPLLRPWLACTLIRLVYCLQVAALALPAAAIAYWSGEAAARARLACGQAPMAHRSHWWLQLLRLAIATMPACCALPVPLPTLPLAVALALVALLALRQARRHFVEL